MGFGISFQKAGLNRPGRCWEGSRERRVAEAWERQKEKGKGGKERQRENEKWRRITGITVEVEAGRVSVSAKERRAGIGRLMARIKESSRKDAEAQRNEETAHGAAHTAALLRGTRMSVTEELELEVAEWAGACGNSVESMCLELSITRARLTMLTKEYCGLTAQEVVDGWKVKELKEQLVGQVREAAQGVWGVPGDVAVMECAGLNHGGHGEQRMNHRGHRGTQRRNDGETGRRGECGRGTPSVHGGSRYFRNPPGIKEERWEKLARRTEELIEAVEAKRREHFFAFEAWAMKLGFGTVARLRRACLNVLGKTLKQIERAIAKEITDYYLCAEDRKLRELASRTDANELVMRARELYWGSDEAPGCRDAPAEPYLDDWATAEYFRAGWLGRMKEAFG